MAQGLTVEGLRARLETPAAPWIACAIAGVIAVLVLGLEATTTNNVEVKVRLQAEQSAPSEFRFR